MQNRIDSLETQIAALKYICKQDAADLSSNEKVLGRKSCVISYKLNKIANDIIDPNCNLVKLLSSGGVNPKC